ncbi:hypothetical protein JCM10295v2_000633 [Rhodotorula toruloides]
MSSLVSHIDQSNYPAAQGVALQLYANWTLGPLFFGWTAAYSSAASRLNLLSLVTHAISLLRGTDALSVLVGAFAAVAAQGVFALPCRRIPRIVQPCRMINHGATDSTRGASPDAYTNVDNLALALVYGAAAERYSSRHFGKKSGRQVLESRQLNLMRVTFEAALCKTITAIVSGFAYVALTAPTSLS